MKHFLIVLIVAVVTLTIVFIIYRPDLLEQIWLWIIGLIGPIIGFAKKGFASLKKLFKFFD
jgi:hypothetical protein